LPRNKKYKKHFLRKKFIVKGFSQVKSEIERQFFWDKNGGQVVTKNIFEE